MKKLISFCLLLLLSGAAFGAGKQEQNKAVARRVFEEIFNQGKFDAAQQIYAADFVNHTSSGDIPLSQDQAAARGWRDAFPDVHVTVDQLHADGDFVTVLWTARGTKTGAGNGLPATGKKLTERGITIWKIVDGKIREEWSAFDQLRILQQLGLAPLPAK
jgi:steroid delta-isomerase-like uncharacterized protein